MTDWTRWPFFTDDHRALAAEVEAWAHKNLSHAHGSDVDAECRTIVVMLGRAGFLKHCVATNGEPPDVRSLAILRAGLAYHAGLADFSFAMQGLGSGAISLYGSPVQKKVWLPRVAAGEAIAAFALTEPDTGSDVARIATTARRDGDGYVLDGAKTFISNGTIADVVTLFARTGAPEDGARGLSAFVLPTSAEGLTVTRRIDTIAPHPLAELRLEGVRLSDDCRLGAEGEGFKVAMRTLNLFRVTVGAAALGFARRALDEALAFARTRPLGGASLAEHPVTEARVADMATALDASALLIARAAWAQDSEPTTDHRRVAAMAKLHATEEAQKVIDAALQLHGGRGVEVGAKVEELYREIRALRIYEGASEVQRQVIGRSLVKDGQ